jgi:hypothetical protein
MRFGECGSRLSPGGATRGRFWTRALVVEHVAIGGGDKGMEIVGNDGHDGDDGGLNNP